MEYKTGTLVEFRQRPWVVQASTDPDLLRLKPLGGTDLETTAIYLPLYEGQEPITSHDFPRPSHDDLRSGHPGAARLLYNACRLSFRDIAGPFASMGRLSFEPRPYQLVPLIMALRQDTIRLLIADDVGIGKTLESLLIAKELLDRHEINRFAVICLPHLCEQWQNEIKDKFGLDAKIIRSSTVTQLERTLRAGQNVFRDIPFQVISIDFVKAKPRADVFLAHCPEFIIVDEAHTCARPQGANNSQQQRYHLLKRLAEKKKQQLVLLTATPHSGKAEEFQSLIGLLDSRFEQYDLREAEQRKELSNYFVQRQRADIAQYLGGEVIFPQRLSIDDDSYTYSPAYLRLYEEVRQYITQGLASATDTDARHQRYLYWDLLALMRGIMSSPRAGIAMLRGKISRHTDTSAQNVDDTDTATRSLCPSLLDSVEGDDTVPDILEQASKAECQQFRSFIHQLEDIEKGDDDAKVHAALGVVRMALDEGMQPIVFCQYIETAEYVGQYIKKSLAADRKTKDVATAIITSRLTDEERKQHIDELADKPRHVLVCTDCLSEGVNLQQGFDAIVHYDLPWNPNRIEQRNGRIDRFGQTAQKVLISTLHAKNNTVDDYILNTLYRKQKRIREQIGVNITIAENDTSIIEALARRFAEGAPQQLTIDFGEDFRQQEEKEIKKMCEEHRRSHTYFAHNTADLNPTNLEPLLSEIRLAIGDTHATRDFVIAALTTMGVNIKTDDEDTLAYSFLLAELTPKYQAYFPAKAKRVKISFASPTPKGYLYIGRNHTLVEDLARTVIDDTMQGTGPLAAARAMVMTTAEVSTKTTVLLLRIRSVICERRREQHQMVGEEMLAFGYQGRIDDHHILDPDAALQLFLAAHAAADTEPAVQSRVYDQDIRWTHDTATLRCHTDHTATQRAQHLADLFSSYRHYVEGKPYKVVEPVLPVDIIAAYIYLPSHT